MLLDGEHLGAILEAHEDQAKSEPHPLQSEHGYAEELLAMLVDAVVTIGCVIEGATQHDEIVVQHAARKIIDLSLEYDKPVSLGISGPGMTRMEATERIDYAKRAVESAVKMVQRLG